MNTKAKINLQELKEIYLVSNTATYLYNHFLKDDSLKQLRYLTPQQQLIEEFMLLANTGIEHLDDLVLAYALYVTILLYNTENSRVFLQTKEGSIAYEWFPEIKSIYLARYKSYSFDKVEVSLTMQPSGAQASGSINPNRQQLTVL